MKTKCLFMFKEFGSLPGVEFPSMTEFFNDGPYSGKEEIIKYLRLGRKTYCATSYARDFFNGKRIPGERCGMTDGVYSWNNELIYYVEEYNLRLPRDFEDYVLNRTGRPSRSRDDSHEKVCEYDGYEIPEQGEDTPENRALREQAMIEFKEKARRLKEERMK